MQKIDTTRLVEREDQMQVYVMLAKNQYYDWYVYMVSLTKEHLLKTNEETMKTAYALSKPKFRIIKRELSLPLKYAISNKKSSRNQQKGM